MKKSIIPLTVLALSISQASLAYCQQFSPFYVGAELGGGNLNYEHQGKAAGALSVNDNGLAGRLLVGMDLNRNVALEMGYTLYKDPELKLQGGAQAKFSQQSLDLLAKISLPVSSYASFYAKGGMSCVHRGDSQVIINNEITNYSDSDDHLRPMLGVGVDYSFNPRVSGNLGYYHTFGVDDLKDADFYGVGLTFRLG
jgi:opacity protein-like surface antigen